jgi:hypothetical protein
LKIICDHHIHMTSKPETHHSSEPSRGHGRSHKRRSGSIRHHQGEKPTAQGLMKRLQQQPVLTLIAAAVAFGGAALYLVIQIAE